jgi:hypothetical protein
MSAMLIWPEFSSVARTLPSNRLVVGERHTFQFGRTSMCRPRAPHLAHTAYRRATVGFGEELYLASTNAFSIGVLVLFS